VTDPPPYKKKNSMWQATCNGGRQSGGDRGREGCRNAGYHSDVCWRMLTYADVCWRVLTYADVCWRMLTYAAESILRRQMERGLPECWVLLSSYCLVSAMTCFSLVSAEGKRLPEYWGYRVILLYLLCGPYARKCVLIYYSPVVARQGGGRRALYWYTNTNILVVY
jgi:hypothetical protein